MSGHDGVAAATDQVQGPAEQSRISRRVALRTAAGAGIAATALAATSGPALAAARPARADRDGASQHGAGQHEAGRHEASQDEAGRHEAEPIVAHLRDAKTGEIDVFRGTSQTRLRDPALAALLIRASR